MSQANICQVVLCGRCEFTGAFYSENMLFQRIASKVQRSQFFFDNMWCVFRLQNWGWEVEMCDCYKTVIARVNMVSRKSFMYFFIVIWKTTLGWQTIEDGFLLVRLFQNFILLSHNGVTEDSAEINRFL